MGMKNMRAICPNCGGKIHTQPKGLGHVMLGANGVFTQTGKQCEHCGVKLTGKVTAKNYAVLDVGLSPRKPSTKLSERPAPNYPGPANETREEYLRRINSHHTPPDAPR